MSYRNPQQYVDTTSAQHFQNLQSTIAGSFANVAKSFAEDQRRIQAENKQRDKENKLIKKGVQKEVSFLNRTLYSTDNKYPEVDFAELYNPLIKEFEDLSLKVEMGTSENPTADKTRLDQIYASVTGITDTLGNLVSFTEDYDEKMDNLNKPGGIYGGGMDPNVNLGLNIFMQKLPGKRVPRFENGDMNKFVWDIYDEQGELVQTFSKQRLDQISKGIDEMVTIIPKTEKDLTAVQEANPNIFQTEQDAKTGKMLPNGKINDNFLGKSKNVYFAKGDTRTNREVNKYGEGGIIFDPNFNATMDSVIASTLGEGETDRSAIALHNTQFNKVKYTKEDFLNNPTFKDKGWTEETLPQFIKDIIEDKENDGFEFDIDGNLDEDEQAVFNVAYKKNFLDKKVPNYIEVIIPDTDKPSEAEIKRQNQKNTLKTLADDLLTFDSKSLRPGMVSGVGSKDIVPDELFQQELLKIGPGFTYKQIIKEDNKDFINLKVIGAPDSDAVQIPLAGLTDVALKKAMYIIAGGKKTDDAYKKLGTEKEKETKDPYDIFARN